jgi:hypothetical protein
MNLGGVPSNETDEDLPHLSIRPASSLKIPNLIGSTGGDGINDRRTMGMKESIGFLTFVGVK